MKDTLLLMTGSALATAALFFASAPARSAPISAATEAVQVIPTADLDLGSAAGRQALDRRIGRAVIELCGEASDADLVGRNAVRECRTDALQQAYRARDQRLALRSGAPIQLAARAD